MSEVEAPQRLLASDKSEQEHQVNNQQEMMNIDRNLISKGLYVKRHVVVHIGDNVFTVKYVICLTELGEIVYIDIDNYGKIRFNNESDAVVELSMVENSHDFDDVCKDGVCGVALCSGSESQFCVFSKGNMEVYHTIRETESPQIAMGTMKSTKYALHYPVIKYSQIMHANPETMRGVMIRIHNFTSEKYMSSAVTITNKIQELRNEVQKLPEIVVQTIFQKQNELNKKINDTIGTLFESYKEEPKVELSRSLRSTYEKVEQSILMEDEIMKLEQLVKQVMSQMVVMENHYDVLLNGLRLQNESSK